MDRAGISLEQHLQMYIINGNNLNNSSECIQQFKFNNDYGGVL